MTKIHTRCAITAVAVLCAALFCVTGMGLERADSEELHTLNMLITVTDKRTGNPVEIADLVDDVTALESIQLINGKSVKIDEDFLWNLLLIDPKKVVSVTDKNGKVTNLLPYTITINDGLSPAISEEPGLYADDEMPYESWYEPLPSGSFYDKKPTVTPGRGNEGGTPTSFSPEESFEERETDTTNAEQITQTAASLATRADESQNDRKTTANTGEETTAKAEETLPQEKGVPVWVWVAIAACAVAGGAIVLWRIKR